MRNRIKFYRLTGRYDPEAFAKMIGLKNYHELYDMESGKKEPDLKTVCKLVKELRVPASELFPSLSHRTETQYENYGVKLDETYKILKEIYFFIVALEEKEGASDEYEAVLAALRTAQRCVRLEKGRWRLKEAKRPTEG